MGLFGKPISPSYFESIPILSLSRVTLLCFAASYVIVLLLELARLVWRTKLSVAWIWLATLAAFVAHTSYLAVRAQEGLTERGLPLSNWYHWCLIVAWGVALAYFLFSLSRPSTTSGLFLLPVVLGLVGLASLFPKNQIFRAERAMQVWSTIHGIGLLLGTICVAVGFAIGLMYLWQANRLKKKLHLQSRVRLPSLEWLGQTNERMLVWSTIFLVTGIAAGIVLNVGVRETNDGVATAVVDWNEPTVICSGILFVWLVSVTIFSAVHRPARVGRKVAYLTISNSLILALALVMAILSRHASYDPAESNDTTTLGIERSDDAELHGAQP